MYRSDLHEALNSAVSRYTRPVALGLAMLYIIFIPSHLLLLPSPTGQTLAGAALFSALLLGGYWLYSQKQAIAPRFAHPIAFAILSIALANSLLHLNLSHDIRQTTTILLIVVGLGGFVLSYFWLLVFLAYASLTWLAVVLGFASNTDIMHYSLTFVSAILVSFVIHLIRYQNLAQLEHLKRDNNAKTQQLENLVEEAEHSEERFRLMAEASFDGVAILDETIILDANRQLLSMFGYSLSELQHQPISQLIADPIETIPFDISVRKSLTQAKFTAIHKEGYQFPIQAIGHTIPFSGQQVRVITIHDVSVWQATQDNLKNYQQKLEVKKSELVQANQAKSAFLATMSHELRTPLTAIIGFTELLKDEIYGNLNDKQHNYVNDIYNSSQQLLSLINDILDLSKVEAGKVALNFGEVDLLDLSKETLHTVEDMAKEKSITLSIDASPVTQALIDRKRIKQVLYNYLTNAVKFTKANGAVTVHLGDDDENFIVEVKDTGIGIAEEHLEQLFEPFSQIDSTTTRQFGGTGLGLVLSKKLIDLHSGRVWVESKLGEGSTFGFSIPKSIDKVIAVTLSQPIDNLSG